jgi:hypothetical protein
VGSASQDSIQLWHISFCRISNSHIIIFTMVAISSFLWMKIIQYLASIDDLKHLRATKKQLGSLVTHASAMPCIVQKPIALRINETDDFRHALSLIGTCLSIRVESLKICGRVDLSIILPLISSVDCPGQHGAVVRITSALQSFTVIGNRTEQPDDPYVTDSLWASPIEHFLTQGLPSLERIRFENMPIGTDGIFAIRRSINSLPVLKSIELASVQAVDWHLSSLIVPLIVRQEQHSEYAVVTSFDFSGNPISHDGVQIFTEALRYVLTRYPAGPLRLLT